MMAQGPGKTLSRKGFRWRLRRGGSAALIDRILTLGRGRSDDAEKIKDNPSRAVFRLRFDDDVFYVKWHRFRGIADALGGMFRGSRAEREWRMALCLEAAGLLTPEPVLLGVRKRFGAPVETILATREVPGLSLKEVAPILAGAAAGETDVTRRALARRLGEFVRRMHDHGISHPDMHLGNFILAEPDGRVCLLDLHAARRCASLPDRTRLQNLAFLYGTTIVHGATASDRLRFSLAYLGADWTRRAARDLERKAARRFEAMRRRRIRSRSRRCILKSRVFTHERTPLGRVYRKRKMSPEQVGEALAAHRRVLAGEGMGNVLKRDRKTAVTLIPWDGSLDAPELCVKEFRREGILMRLLPARIRHKPAMNAWRASLGLIVRGVAAPEALALVMGRGASSFVVMRVIADSLPLDLYLHRKLTPDRPTAERRDFARAAGDFLIGCCAAGVLHTDLKARNVLVREPKKGQWEFLLLDLEAVRFREHVGSKDLLLNMAQLNASTPLTFTWADRLRFLRFAAAWRPELGERASLDEIGRLTRMRKVRWRL